MPTTIEVIGDYDPAFPPHAATDAALQHAQPAVAGPLIARWLPTRELDASDGKDRIRNAGGFFVAPGSPYQNMAGVLAAIRFAREQKRPLLATCGGFQHVILEYARNILGIEDAAHAEYDPYASCLFISRLTCSLVGRTLPITLQPGSNAARHYGQTQIDEQYYCNFGVNPDSIPQLRFGSLQIVGSDSEGEIRVVELPDHPFYIATLFVPQLRSTPTQPHPLLIAFLQAAASQH